MGEEAQLFERLRRLEFGRRQLAIAGQGRAVVAVDADVDPVGTSRHPLGRVDPAQVRDRAAREVDGLAVLGADDLDDARREQALGGGDPRDRGDQRAAGLLPAGDEPVEQRGLDERFVALHVEKEVAGEPVDDARHACRAGRTGRVGHQHLGTEAAGDVGHFLGVGEQDDAVGLADLTGAFPDMLDDGLTAEVEHDLARQARRGETGGDAEGDGGHLNRVKEGGLEGTRAGEAEVD